MKQLFSFHGLEFSAGLMFYFGFGKYSPGQLQNKTIHLTARLVGARNTSNALIPAAGIYGKL